MSAVLLAVFNDYEAAERVRTDLVRDGFPTDRVDLTACCEPGRAGVQPADSLHGKFSQYFRTLFCTTTEELRFAEQLVERVEQGAATVTIHPRGSVETARAMEILEIAHPVEIAQHDLSNQKGEHAAARSDSAWMSHFWIQTKGEYHCIYCRMFPGSTHSEH